MRCALIVLLLAVALLPDVEARTVIPPSRQKSTSLASVVAKVQIVKSTPLMVGETECAYEYEANIRSVKKGVVPHATPFRFGVLGGLEVGKTYVVYLQILETKSEFVRLMEERSVGLDAVRSVLEKCPVVTPIPMFFRADRVINE